MMVDFVTFCRRVRSGVPGRERESGIVRTIGGKPRSIETKKIAIKPGMFLKTKEDGFCLSAKTNPGRAKLEPETRVLNTCFKHLFQTPVSNICFKHLFQTPVSVLLGWCPFGGSGLRHEGLGAETNRNAQQSATKYEIRENKAKEYLKTKDITFFNAAN